MYYSLQSHLFCNKSYSWAASTKGQRRVSELRTIEISGPPRERGRQYGEAVADLITQAIEYYSGAFWTQVSRTWEELRLEASRWLPLCEATAPELVEEMRGIAEGAGRELLDILLLNLRGEIIYDAESRPTTEPDAHVEGCTSFALFDQAAGDGHVYAGQNWDWRAGAAPTVMILRIKQDPLPTITMQVEAGQIGRHGANSAGIALNANGLGGRFGSGLGLPQTFIRRLVLNQAELSDALNTLFRLPTHISSNTLITYRGGFAIDVESTPEGHHSLEADGGLLVHGNHYQGPLPSALRTRYRPVSVDSLYRVPRTIRGLREAANRVTPEAVRAVIHESMSDHLGFPESVCTHPDTRRPLVRQWATLLSSCVDLTSGEYRVSAGTPCANDYTLLPWNLLDGPGSAFAIPPTSRRSQ